MNCGKDIQKTNIVLPHNSQKSISYILMHNCLVRIFFKYLIFMFILGNILIMIAIIITKSMHDPTNILIFNLSLADFFVSTIIDGFTVVGKQYS